MATAVVWFRRDLRLGENPSWADATNRFDRVVPLFVVDPRLWDRCSPVRVGLLAAHLRSLDKSLRELGGRLLVERGDPAVVVPSVAARFGAETVVVNRDVTPFARGRDDAVAAKMDLVGHWGTVVHPPGSLLTGSGTRYRVFTPFARAWFARQLPVLGSPGAAEIVSEPGVGVPSDAPGSPLPAGEASAWERLDAHCGRVDDYDGDRDRPDLDSTSRLSVDLKYGAISPASVVAHVGSGTAGRRAFIRQIVWRDFYAHLLEDSPATVSEPMRPQYAGIAWHHDPEGFEAWTSGTTGYPIVDAGMRQLAGEGWMHNRVRMIAASFLVKDLLIDWRSGERFFRRHLIDGDVPQNVGNWQWVAGTGADAAPYFRIFNPVTQSQRFDPHGDYIRRWVPELRRVPARWIHAPWDAPPFELAESGVVVGETYPAPIVDHAVARDRTLAAYKQASGR